MPVDPLDGFVNTAYTLTIGDLDADEALITISSAPRVLNLPIIGETLFVFAAYSALDFNVTGFVVPPLVDLELIIARLRIGLRVGAGAGIDILMVGIANECDCVIERRTTVIGLLNNTAFVELEGGLACIKSNSERLLSQLGLYFSDTAFNLFIGVDFAHGLALIVTAFVLSHGSS